MTILISATINGRILSALMGGRSVGETAISAADPSPTLSASSLTVPYSPGSAPLGRPVMHQSKDSMFWLSSAP